MAAVAQTPVRKPVSLKREIGLISMLWASMGSIIGSGWLFGALNASLIAGPASLVSWVLGGAAVVLLSSRGGKGGATSPLPALLEVRWL